MWNSEASGGDGEPWPGEGVLRRYCVAAYVNDDLIAAVEGWRRAHGIADQPEALGELVRLGLMSEVAKIYRLVCQDKQPRDRPVDADGKRRRHPRPRRLERQELGLPAN
ncbi:hypothetical protein [Aureimonas leprariae]|uniref:hypothetical protein n=1 Tax=Plantimonas leprariae TaxID=2615207 RepID=UPI001386CC71|nr:hypothetical protein [Aureimonas leprariae]